MTPDSNTHVSKSHSPVSHPHGLSRVRKTLKEQRPAPAAGKGRALTCQPHGPGTGSGHDGQSRGSGDRSEGSPGGTGLPWPHVFLLANTRHLAYCKKDANFTR